MSETREGPQLPRNLRVLVTGGRDYDDRAQVFAWLDRMHEVYGVSCVIHGACPTGADRFADEWGERRQVGRLSCPAQWHVYGAKAGPLRNGRMLEHLPDVVLAFPGNRGTADMVRRARQAGVHVMEVGAALPFPRVRRDEHE